jgi:hypothetical protein
VLVGIENKPAIYLDTMPTVGHCLFDFSLPNRFIASGDEQ